MILEPDNSKDGLEEFKSNYSEIPYQSDQPIIKYDSSPEDDEDFQDYDDQKSQVKQISTNHSQFQEMEMEVLEDDNNYNYWGSSSLSKLFINSTQQHFSQQHGNEEGINLNLEQYQSEQSNFIFIGGGLYESNDYQGVTNQQIMRKKTRKISQEKKSHHWNSDYEEQYKQLWQFINRESKWNNLSKESPNIFVYVICNYTGDNQNLIQWEGIVKELENKLIIMNNDWKTLFNTKIPIKLLKNKVKCHKPKKKFLKPKQKQKNYLSYSLKNFQTLCKEENIKQEFKESESFTSIQDKLDKELGDLKIKQEKKESIESLKDLVKQIKYHKEKNLTKKTINFNQQDILDLCNIQEIKQQVELIIKLIKSPDADFLKYIENEAIVGHLQVLVEKVQEMNSKPKDS